MFTASDRDKIRTDILRLAQADPSLSGGAITGSASVGEQDEWSDIDLAFGVREGISVPEVIERYSQRMYREHGALHHLDVPSGAWIYRVFLLASTLQVDLAFVPEAHFGALAPTFRLEFGTSIPAEYAPKPSSPSLLGWAWLYALHARSSLRRGRLWQAEFYISGMRGFLVSLYCLRFGLPLREGRGVDRLPQEIKEGLAAGLVRVPERQELKRAFLAVTENLLEEARRSDPEIVNRIEAVLRELTNLPQE